MLSYVLKPRSLSMVVLDRKYALYMDSFNSQGVEAHALKTRGIPRALKNML
jgi:hypothetical protein